MTCIFEVENDYIIFDVENDLIIQNPKKVGHITFLVH